MTTVHSEGEASERQDEFLALINMLAYAENAAESLGAASASWYIDVARQSLQSALQSEIAADLSHEDIINLSAVRAGRC